MKKIIVILIIGFSSWNCVDRKEAKNLMLDLQNLQKENDSLKMIISKVNQKYVFDNVGIRTIPSYKNTDKLNSISRSEIVIIGYNNKGNTKVMFNDFENLNIKYSDTLRMENGGFIFEQKLVNEKNFFNGKIESKNKYGKNYLDVISIGIWAQ